MNASKTRIAIYGAGAMGTVLGALLTKGGLKPDLITRNKSHVALLNSAGATLVCEAENREITTRVNGLLPEEMSGKYDVIFLMTKQRQNEEILNFLLPYLADDGVVCTTQNGLPEASVAAVVGNQRAYGAVTTYGATFLEAGKVALTSKLQAMRMSVCGYENDNAKSGLLVEILSYAGKAIDNAEFAEMNENLQGARWSKLAINAAFSGLSVVTGCTFGVLAKRRKSRKVALGILRECFAVAKALGVTLEKMQGHDMEKFLGGNSAFERLVAYLVLPFAMRKHKKLVSGMLKDVENGKKCEIDYIDGVVSRMGKQAQVETPLCDRVVEITHGIENGLYETDYKNLDFFEG